MTAAPIRDILLATDFSEPSHAAAHVAAVHARQFHARVHLFHVHVGEEPVAPLLGGIAAELGKDLTVLTAMASGDPAQAIVDYARQHAIDVIVVGTHGRTGVSRMLLGSVAERVVRTAPCPVLAVPSAAGTESPTESAPAAPAASRCLVCAAESRDLVCEPCRARIRGEALERKHREEHAARF